MPEDTTPDGEDDDYTTSDPRTRWEGLATVITFFVFLSFVALILGAALGTLTLATIGQPWFVLYSLIVLMAATWLYGKETLESVQKARGK